MPDSLDLTQLVVRAMDEAEDGKFADPRGTLFEHYALFVLAALRSVGALREWQSIETVEAPKTGNIFEGYLRHAKGFGTRAPACHWLENEYWMTSGPIREPWKLTYWMAISPDPEDSLWKPPQHPITLLPEGHSYYGDGIELTKKWPEDK